MGFYGLFFEHEFDTDVSKICEVCDFAVNVL